MIKFPEVVRYEVHEVSHDGTTSGVARGMSSWIDSARQLADGWTAEARERYEAESRNPILKARGITPDPPRTFVVVKVTEKREVI